MQDGIKDWVMIWLGAALGLAFLLPNHYSPWLSFHQELVAAVAFAPVMTWAWLQRRAPPALACAVALLALVPLAQTVTGQLYFAGDGWLSFLYLLGLALAIHAGACCVRQACEPHAIVLDRLAPMCVGLVVAGFVSVAIAVHQWLMLAKLGLFIVDLPPHGRPFANLAQPNHLATLLLLAIAGLLFLWELGKLRATIAMAGVLLLTFGLVMTGSRSVLLTIAWLIPAYTLLRRRCALRTTPLAFFAVIGLYLLLAWNWEHLNGWLLLPTEVDAAIDRMATPGIRKVYWMSMLDALGRAPWAGYGWGQIGAAQTLTALDYPPTHSFFDSSHNLFIDLGLWSGLPVALLVVAALVLWFSWQIRHCSSPLAWATLAAIGMVFSHAMVEYPLSYAYFLLPVGLCMGALSALQPSPLDRLLQRWIRPRVAVPAAGLIALILFVAVVVEYPPYEEDWSLMRFQEARVGDLTPTEPPPHLLLTQLDALIRYSRAEARPGMSAHDLEWMRRVSQRYAYFSLMYKYALAQGLNGQPEGASQTLAKLCQMHTQAMCEDSRRHWKALTQKRYPQLGAVPLLPLSFAQ